MAFSPKHYHFTTFWTFKHPLPVVWEELIHPERWPSWWKGVKEAEILHEGDSLSVGAQTRFAWQSVLPYTLCFTGTTIEVKPNKMVKGSAEGDLNGTGIWYFNEENAITSLRYEWDVSTAKPWMNALGPIGKPFFSFAHNHLMKQGERGLTELLDKNKA